MPKADIYYVRIIHWLYNRILPLIFKLTSRKRFSLYHNENKNKKHDGEVIISLTTFPARIKTVWLTIETLLRQNIKPDRIFLWLYKGEVSSRESLPKRLLNLEKRGLEIKFCDKNLMPHKKYFYTMKKFPKATVITVDDDIFYPVDLIKNLLHYSKQYPGTIICCISRKIIIEGDQINLYDQWPYMRVNTKPSFNIISVGVGGTLYPPNSLHPDVFNLNILKRMSLTADDLWLKIMSLKNNTKVVSIAGEYPRHFLCIRIRNDKKLMDINILKNENNLIFNRLIDQYDVKHILTGNKADED